MEDKYAQLRESLRDTTNGPWKVEKELTSRSGEWLVAYDAGDKGRGIAIAETIPCTGKELFNARYIASANPSTIQSLLEERDAFKEALEMISDMYHYDMSLGEASLSLYEASNIAKRVLKSTGE